jgi:hypothetical protein
MDKLAVIRTMSSFGDDHPQAVHYAATGHLHNPAMQFPSLGSIVGKELGAQERHAALRHRAALGERPAVRRLFPVGVPRAGLRPDADRRPLEG